MNKSKIYNILIFPAGSEIAFEINNALKYSKFIKVFGGSSINDHSAFVYNNYCCDFPYITDDNFIDYLNEYIKINKIDFIYPAMDNVQVFLTNNQEKIKARIITSDKDTVNICRSKEETYKHLSNEKFIPKFYNDVVEITCYPVFVKPKIGQGAQGVKKIENKEQLAVELSNNSDLIICEYLPGVEYTIDCFTDKNRQLRIANIRSRDRIRTGISVRSSKAKLDEKIVKISNIINEYFNFNGAWFFQMKKNINGELKLMEISPRIPGTMGLSRNIGVNFPLLTIYNMIGYDIDLLENDYNIMVDRAFINRYKLGLDYEFVYIDFDDTVICNDKVNLDVIRFIYQSLNNKKKIYLLTRHKQDIYKSLKKYKISNELFDDIIEVKGEELKSKYITKNNSIFIDDSFKERKDVKDNLNIPVFDVDMVECLLDWRV